jgi:CubicO group peptidase (beta-lactamase class C family)
MTAGGSPETALHAFVRDAKTPGLQYLAVDRSTTLVEHCDGAADLATNRQMTPAASLMAYSMSKTITAAAILQLVDTNTIGLDDSISRYLDVQPYGDAVTVRHLLSHTSGIPNPIPLRWVHPAAAHESFDERAALDDVLRRHPRLVFPPGSKYAYSNIGYWLLGRIIERVCGQPFVSYVIGHVLQALGIAPADLGYLIRDPSTHASGYLEKYSLVNLVKSFVIDRALIGDYKGRWLRINDHYPNGPAFGGLVGTAGGFASFLQNQLRPGSQLFGDRTRRLLYEAQRTTRGTVIAMTLGWHIGSGPAGPFYFKEGGGGGFHSLMRLYLSKGIGTVVMTNATGVNVHRMLDIADAPLLGRR